jgi:hypothetical protein
MKQRAEAKCAVGHAPDEVVAGMQLHTCQKQTQTSSASTHVETDIIVD